MNKEEILEINNKMLFNSDNMGIEVKPFSYPDVDENLKYISTYIKGKKNNFDNIRILMQGVKSNKFYFILFLIKVILVVIIWK